jgi:HK97 gp10 family phage protein
MASRDEVIVGGRQLDDLLKRLAPKLERNIMRGALRAGTVPIREDVKRRAPVDSGALRNSVRTTSRARKGQVSASVKVGNREAWYAHLIEFGTRPHVIKAKPGRAMQFGGRITAQVNHPGITGKPFIRPAADATTPEAIREVTKYIRKRLTKEGINTPDNAPRDPAE